MAFTDGEVTRIVADTIKKQLAPCEVGVHVRKSFDEDGDPLLVIMVVIGTECEPDRKKMLGLVRHIRSNLDDATAAGFPLVSFVSKRDAAKMDFEAA